MNMFVEDLEEDDIPVRIKSRRNRIIDHMPKQKRLKNIRSQDKYPSKPKGFKHRIEIDEDFD